MVHYLWEFSSVGRVPALQAEGHRFESYNSHQFFYAGVAHWCDALRKVASGKFLAKADKSYTRSRECVP